MTKDTTADDLKMKVKKYSDAASEALQAGNIEASQTNWERALAAFRKWKKHLKDKKA